MFRNESTDIDYRLIGRVEWNLTEVLDTEVLDISAGALNWSHGWYRKANGNEYLWKLENGTSGSDTQGMCNETDTTFVISKYPENSSGYARDLTSANIITAPTPAGNNANWAYFHFNSSTGGPLEGYCVASYWDCTRIYIYKYDMSYVGADGFGDCAMARYFATESLEPGERLDKLKIKPTIPYGTPAGDAIQTTLTIYCDINPNS